MAWSLGLFHRDPLQGIVGDTLILGTTLTGLWYLSLFVSSAWRLQRYKTAAHELPWQLYQLLYPWIGLLVINFTVLVTVSLAQTLNIPRFRENLYKVLLAEFAPLIAAEIPILKNWLPKFEPIRFFGIFRKALSILLGRELGTTVEEHAKNVVEFQLEFVNYLQSDPKMIEKASPSLAPYYNSTQLSVFQNTLSCLFDTSCEIGTRIGREFTSRSWTMLDVGCGEGIFSAELLNHFQTLPQVITAIDPSDMNISAFRERIANRFPTILNIDAAVGTVEEQIDDFPDANLVLASHSLYALLDQNRRSAGVIVPRLLSNAGTVLP